MKILKLVPLAFFLLFSFSAFAADHIQDLTDMKVPVNANGSSPSADDVKQAIIEGCRKRGWSPSVAGDKIVASILVRSKFYAEVEIPYTSKSYSILYKDSRELGYDEKKRKIHRNYNKWVTLLSASIQREFGVHSQMY